MAVVLLVAALLLLAWFVRRDIAEYRVFKALTRTEDRQRAFRHWTVRAFFLFGVFAVVALLLLGRIQSLVEMPPEFLALSRRAAGSISGSEGMSAGFLGGLVVAILTGGLIGTLIASRRQRGDKGSATGPVVGDIEPLFPRNGAERRWTALLAANAGPSEELFFRLMLPLLLVLVTGNAAFAFAVAALLFGLMHLYQGWVGVLGTTFAGILFTWLYLMSGSIWLPVALHLLINLNALWLRPLLLQRGNSR